MFDLAWRTIASDPRVIALPEPPALILVREAYYLEVEADGAALQWLMQSRPPASLGRLLTGPRVPLADTVDAGRAVSFRMLLAGVWLVIRLMEARRDCRS